MGQRVLCYGASNTWGYNPGDGSRFAENVRWPGVLRACLGVELIEEGLNGRTLLSYEPQGSPYNGLEHLFARLRDLPPVSLLILFLGTNDLLAQPQPSAGALAQGLFEALQELRLTYPQMRLLLIPPLPLWARTDPEGSGGSRRDAAEAFSAELRRVARQCDCLCFDASKLVAPSPIDGVHLEAEAHWTLGRALCTYIREAVDGFATDQHGV
jgi:lysophospholipase L1-like esterase